MQNEMVDFFDLESSGFQGTAHNLNRSLKRTHTWSTICVNGGIIHSGALADTIVSNMQSCTRVVLEVQIGHLVVVKERIYVSRL
jgi:hypothetical protein